MPSFGGENIFGTAVAMRTADNPRERQINSFFGIGGLETLDGGARGRYTEVTGVLLGTPATGLAGAEALFRSFNDGVARTLVDSSGTVWTNVRLDSFQPGGRVKRSPYGYFFRPYRARFLHLV